LAQAAVWIVVPMLFYAAPPGDLPQVLAIATIPASRAGRSALAYWVAEIAFRAAGLFGVYALSQLCVVVTYWCVFALGRAIVGPSQAAMAVLLMVGISLFTVPTPEFGPPILAMRCGRWCCCSIGRPRCSVAAGAGTHLAFAAALLLLTSEAALILLGTLVLYIAVTERGRATLSPVDPWIVVSRWSHSCSSICCG